MRSHITAVCILLCFAITSAHAQSVDALQSVLQARTDSVNSVAVDQGQGKVAVAVKYGDGSQVIILSLQDCVEDRRFNYGSPINQILTSPRESGVFFGGEGATLKKWNMTDGTELLSITATNGEPIQGLSITNDGNFIAAWGSKSLSIIDLQTAQPTVIWSETTSFPIADIAIDPQTNNIYIGGADGTLVKRSTTGAQVNSFVLEAPIRSMAIDPGRQVIFIADGRQLLKYDIYSTVFVRMATIQADNIRFSGDLSTLAAIGSRGYTLFSYPDFKVLQMGEIPNNKFAMMKNGNIVTFNNNTLHFYDSRKNALAGTIHLMDNGVGFISADLNYFGGDNFKDAILKSLLSDVPAYVAQSREADKIKACAPFMDLLTGMPIRPQTPQATAPAPQIPQPTTPRVIAPIIPPIKPPATPNNPQASNPGAPQVSTPRLPQTGTPVIPKNPAINAPSVGVAPTTPTMPNTPGATTPPQTTTSPQAPIVPPVTLAPGADIPSWVMNPATLPAYSSVKSGTDASQALNEAKRKIRDDVARDLMKTMLNVDMVKNLPSDDLKKRFLWMVAGQTGQKAMQYVMQTDLWVSPQGQYYVLAQVDTESVNQIYEPAFQEEMKQLSTFGEEQYMQREPVKWE